MFNGVGKLYVSLQLYTLLEYEIKNTVIDDEGRYILLEMTIQESPFLLLNLFAPTKLNEQIVFFQEILSVVQSANFDTECKVIIGGDFNVHLDADLDNSRGQIETKSTVKNVQDIMLEYNLIKTLEFFFRKRP